MLGLSLQGNFLLPFSNIRFPFIIYNIFAFIREEFLLKYNLFYLKDHVYEQHTCVL